MHRLILLIQLISLSTILVGQNKSISILSLDTEFMLPTIEEQLSQLRYKPSERIVDDSIVQWRPYFSRVINLNTQRENNNIYSEIKSIFDLNNILGNRIPDQIDSKTKYYKDYISKTILANEYLLLLKNNNYGNYLECQFLLYRVPKQYGISLAIDQHLLAKENFILDLSQDPKKKIKDKLKALFEDSNNKPKAKLFVDGVGIKSDTILEVPINLEITIDGTYSYDKDGDELSYQWKNLYTTKKPETFKPIAFSKGEAIQKIKSSELKISGIQFFVNDGANNSDTINVFLNYIREPKSIIYDTKLYYFRYENLLSRKKSDSIFYNILYYDDAKYIKENKIILTSKSIKQPKLTKDVMEINKSYVLPHEKLLGSQEDIDSLIICNLDYKDHDSIYIYSYSQNNEYLNEIATLQVVTKYRSPLNLYINQSFQSVLSEFNKEGSESTITRFGFGTYLSNHVEIVYDFNFYNSIINIDEETYSSFPFVSLGIRYNIFENIENHNFSDYFFTLGVSSMKHSINREQDLRTIYVNAGGGFRLFEKHNWPINFVSKIGVSSNLENYLSLELDLGIRYNIGGN